MHEKSFHLTMLVVVLIVMFLVTITLFNCSEQSLKRLLPPSTPPPPKKTFLTKTAVAVLNTAFISIHSPLQGSSSSKRERYEDEDVSDEPSDEPGDGEEDIVLEAVGSELSEEEYDYNNFPTISFIRIGIGLTQQFSQ